MRRACQIHLSDADRTTLERWSRGRSIQARLVTRARVVLAAAAGKENKDIAAELNISRGTAARWRTASPHRASRVSGRAATRGTAAEATPGPRAADHRDDHPAETHQRDTGAHAPSPKHWAPTVRWSTVSGAAHGLKPHLCPPSN